jgi:hypothetical protein
MIRLTSRFWVDAYLARLRVNDIAAFVVAHGDDTAGAVLVKSATLNGKAKLYQRSYDLLEDTRKWDILSEGDERDVDASIAKQRQFDSDVWVIEVEDRVGRTLLDQQGLE